MKGYSSASRGVGNVRLTTGFSVLLCCILGCEDSELVTTDFATAAQALSSTTTFQNGTNGYDGTTDSHIRESAPSTNYGSAQSCEADGNETNGTDKSCLIRWDVSSVPASATVQAASVTLRITNSSSNTYSIYALRRAWAEAATTWNAANQDTSWQTSGALGAEDRGAVIGSVTGSGTKTVSLNAAGVALVQAWVRGDGNFGFVIADSANSDGLAVASSEYSTVAYRPKLTIQYVDSAGVGGANGGGGATTGGGATGGSGSVASATAAGGTSTTSTASGGTSSGPEPNLLVAFLGDQGNAGGADSVLNLVKSENAAAVVHNGDFDYENNPTAWNTRIDSILGSNYPYFAVVGNHDAANWDGPNGYASYINARMARVPEMQCQGEAGVKATCRFRGLPLVQSCVGTSELSGHGDCSKDSAEQRSYLHDALANAASPWAVCLWHKNQNDMQLGTKSDEVGWGAYQECMRAGAFIITGHEHSYSRTLTLTDVGNAASGHGKMGDYDALNLAAGKTLVFVSGLGGKSVRDYDASSHNDDTWWAAQYAANRWMKSGIVQSGTGALGALFIRFNVDGDPKLARGYFKDVNGRVADEFTIRVP